VCSVTVFAHLIPADRDTLTFWFLANKCKQRLAKNT
jgi:hypothetical protein